MTAEATVVIKGRNDLSRTVHEAERDLRRLANTGELVGKLLRGGAIVAAAKSFEVLAENAEKAAVAIGDKGTARSLHLLNQRIDELKAKGVNLIGKVLGSFAVLQFGTEYDKALESTQFQIDELKKKLAGGTFGIVLWGPGGRAQAERDLADYEAKLKRLMQNQPYGLRTSIPGGRNRSGTPDPSAPPAKGRAGSREFSIDAASQAYIDREEARAEAYYAGIAERQQLQNELQRTSLDGLEAIGDEMERQYADVVQGNTEMTVFAEQAARNMQTAFAVYLFDPFHDGLKGMAKGFIDMIRSMVAEIAAQQILRSFFTWGAGLGGAVGGFFGDMLGSLPGKAGGGSVYRGHPYIVGERGPELFVPSSSGSIVPNGTGVVVNQYNTIDASGADAERIMAVMPALLERNKQATVLEIRKLVGQGRI